MAVLAPPAPVITTKASDTPLAHDLEHHENTAIPLDAAWSILPDPARIAACVPGMRLLRYEGELVKGPDPGPLT